MMFRDVPGDDSICIVCEQCGKRGPDAETKYGAIKAACDHKWGMRFLDNPPRGCGYVTEFFCPHCKYEFDEEAVR
jgi:hypothetical protein